MMTDTLSEMATFDRGAAYWRVFLHLATKLDTEQPRLIHYEDIARQTRLARRSVERAMVQLIADHAIIKDDKRRNGQVNGLRLNRRLASTTRAEKWNAAEASAADPAVEDARGR